MRKEWNLEARKWTAFKVQMGICPVAGRKRRSLSHYWKGEGGGDGMQSNMPKTGEVILLFDFPIARQWVLL